MAWAVQKIMMIESLNAKEDLFQQRSVCTGLQHFLSLSGIDTVLFKIKSKAEFLECLKIFKESAAEALHLSCHGNSEGIEFTNGEKLKWMELYGCLNHVIEGKVLCLSSCQASSTNELVDLFESGDRQPKFLIGSPDAIWMHDAFVSWSILYGALGNAAYEESKIDGATRMSRSLASIALARGCQMKIVIFSPGNKPMPWTTLDCLEWLCAGQVEKFGLDSNGSDVVLLVNKK